MRFNINTLCVALLFGCFFALCASETTGLLVADNNPPQDITAFRYLKVTENTPDALHYAQVTPYQSFVVDPVWVSAHSEQGQLYIVDQGLDKGALLRCSLDGGERETLISATEGVALTQVEVDDVNNKLILLSTQVPGGAKVYTIVITELDGTDGKILYSNIDAQPIAVAANFNESLVYVLVRRPVPTIYAVSYDGQQIVFLSNHSSLAAASTLMFDAKHRQVLWYTQSSNSVVYALRLDRLGVTVIENTTAYIQAAFVHPTLGWLHTVHDSALWSCDLDAMCVESQDFTLPSEYVQVVSLLAIPQLNFIFFLAEVPLTSVMSANSLQRTNMVGAERTIIVELLQVTALTINPLSEKIFYGTRQGTLERVNLAGTGEWARLSVFPSVLTSVVINPEAELAYVASGGGVLSLPSFSFTAYTNVTRVLPASDVHAQFLSLDTAAGVLYISDQQQWLVWSYTIAGGQLTQLTNGFPAQIDSFYLSTEERKLYVGCDDGLFSVDLTQKGIITPNLVLARIPASQPFALTLVSLAGQQQRVVLWIDDAKPCCVGDGPITIKQCAWAPGTASICTPSVLAMFDPSVHQNIDQRTEPVLEYNPTTDSLFIYFDVGSNVYILENVTKLISNPPSTLPRPTVYIAVGQYISLSMALDSQRQLLYIPGSGEAYNEIWEVNITDPSAPVRHCPLESPTKNIADYITVDELTGDLYFLDIATNAINRCPGGCSGCGNGSLEIVVTMQRFAPQDRPLKAIHFGLNGTMPQLWCHTQTGVSVLDLQSLDVTPVVVNHPLISSIWLDPAYPSLLVWAEAKGFAIRWTDVSEPDPPVPLFNGIGAFDALYINSSQSIAYWTSSITGKVQRSALVGAPEALLVSDIWVSGSALPNTKGLSVFSTSSPLPPDSSSESEEHNHHSNKTGIVLGILLPLLFIGAAVGGFLYYRHKQRMNYIQV